MLRFCGTNFIPRSTLHLGRVVAVQDVFCSIPDAQVVLVDWDQDPDPPFPRDDLARGQNDCSALVGSFDARSLNDLADTDEEFAIHDAQEKGLINEPIFAVS